ncbi:MAG: alpha/beta hydrolase, partial [Myxococcales bacterium]|nr:alpha/beta hydrolase [Myxococcales bacterium]
GLSLGGNTLLHAAAQQPERFSALVLVSTTLEYDERARAIMRQMRFDALPEVEQQRMRAVHGGGEAQIDALIAAVRSMPDDPAGATLADADLSRIAAPALVVYGDRDPLYPLEMALRQARGLPRGELWVVPAEAHLPVFGAWRPTFEAQALAFIERAINAS